MIKLTEFLAKVMLVFVSSSSIVTRAQQSFDQTNLELSITTTTTTPQPEVPCKCRPYYQCKENGEANTQGEGTIDIRSGPIHNEFVNRPKCPNYLDVCCKDPVPPPSPKPPTTPPPPPPPPPPSPSPNRGCGFRNPGAISARITGNYQNEANFAEFPWMVAVFRSEISPEKTEIIYQCGGSLINPRVVLTAAHCVADKEASEVWIRAGEWDTQTQNEPFPHQDRRVGVIEVHPDYKPRILHNDFALLILETPVMLAENVQVACLPDQDQIIESKNCFATGWGKDQFGNKGKYQVILKAVELPTIPHQECQTKLQKSRLGDAFRLHPTFMCAGGEDGHDTCSGDGGSPLVCPISHDQRRYAQVGIVAWGIGCAQPDRPGVYADVSKARDWIDNELARRRIDTSSYRSDNPESPNYKDRLITNDGWGLFDLRKS